MAGHTSQEKFNLNIKNGLKEISDYIPDPVLNSVQKTLHSDEPDYWEIANQIGNFYNDHKPDEKVRSVCLKLIEKIRVFQGEKAKVNADTTTVVFGTSGWRGVIGEDFTVLNVHKVVRGIINMMKTEEFLRTNGYTSFEEVKQHGILLLRDNRFMGDTFMQAAMHELAHENIIIYRLGECPTGVGSALLTELKAAGSINFTPSHNPMEYAGIKLNPADGGPADKNLTSIIEQEANAYMQPGGDFTKATEGYEDLVQDINGAEQFERFILEKSRVFDLQAIRSWMMTHKKELYMVIDFMHGSSRGYIEHLLGTDLVGELEKSGSVRFVNTNDDYSFHGVKPEPSAKNQKTLIEYLQANKRTYTLAVALDPDADRIRYADAEMDIDMNRFGAIAYAHLLAKGMKGAICSTVPSSDFALEIARKNGYDVYETAVGFKYFRPMLRSGKVLVAFEESDGISVMGHTLEKCALAGFLLALDAIATQESNLSEQYRNLQERYGYYYPSKAGADVKGVSVEAWQTYKAEVLDILQNRLFREGDMILIAGSEKRISQINTADGIKIIFDDKSWILLRPSGTEPKFRYYYEFVSEHPVEQTESILAAYENAASNILEKARALADG
jgi:phosphomannomutase